MVSILPAFCRLSQADALRVCVAVQVEVDHLLGLFERSASEAVDCLDVEAVSSGGDCHVAVVRFHVFTLS